MSADTFVVCYAKRKPVFEADGWNLMQRFDDNLRAIQT